MRTKKRWKHVEGWPRSKWDHDHGFPRRAAVRRHRRHLFISFVAFFGVVALLVLGGMAALAFLFSRLLGGDGQTAVLVWVMGCGLALALPLLAAAVAARAFRGIATPLADVMGAADAVADGDLGARVPVPEHGPREFARLAVSFNHMAEELERADQRRRNLTADVAHELRTPLHIIQGNLEGVLDGVYEPTDAHINATLEEMRTLARLVEDLRTLSRAESGQLRLEREPVDVAELLADVGTSFSGQAEAAAIELRVEFGKGASNESDDVEADEFETKGEAPCLMVIGDAGRLDQVLSNLLANAFRHTPPGGIITLRGEPILRQGSGQALRRNSGQSLRQGSGQALRQGSGQALRQGSGQAPRQGSGQALRQGSGQALRQGSGQALRQGSGQALRQGSGQALRQGSGQALEGVRIVVADTGEGIPPEDLSYIFDRFWRGDRSRTHTHGAGSGLGLAIARQLVQAHDGRIEVESELGQGTTFTIELPTGA